MTVEQYFSVACKSVRVTKKVLFSVVYIFLEGKFAPGSTEKTVIRVIRTNVQPAGGLKSTFLTVENCSWAHSWHFIGGKDKNSTK